jgi:hypothetical protein
MNRYETSIPRTAFGIAAIALSAITLGVSVVLPASLTFQRQEAPVLAAPHVGGAVLHEVAILPSRIDVVVDCPQKLALERTQRLQPKRDQAS